MPTITDAIQELSHFNHYRKMPEILTALRSLIEGSAVFRALGMSKKIDDGEITSLRANLNEILSNETKRLWDDKNESSINGIYLTDACHSALLAVAEFRPLNLDDPITLEKINSSNNVFVSTGHQFDIYTLINYNHNRNCRAELNEEQINFKQLLNPVTNQKFSYRDATHIRNVAQHKKISITSLVNVRHASLMTYAEFVKIKYSRVSIDEIMDCLGLLLNAFTDMSLQGVITWFNNLLANMDVLTNKAIDWLALCVILSGCKVAMWGYVADHLIVDIADWANPSSSKSRAGFLEAGIVIGGSMVISALIARSMFRTERNARPVNEREQDQQHHQYAAHQM